MNTTKTKLTLFLLAFMALPFSIYAQTTNVFIDVGGSRPTSAICTPATVGLSGAADVDGWADNITMAGLSFGPYSFNDPVPPGNKITHIEIVFHNSDCTYNIDVEVASAMIMGVMAMGSCFGEVECPASSARGSAPVDFGCSTSTDYNYGGVNQFDAMLANANTKYNVVTFTHAELIFTYEPCLPTIVDITGDGMMGPYGPGNYEFQLPAGCSANITYEAWGGGGAGGYAKKNHVAGGGSGAYINCSTPIAIGCGSTYTATVGVGGSIPAAVATTPAENGGSTIVNFGAVATAGGGESASDNTPGTGGTATGCDLSIDGDPGVAGASKIGGDGGTAPSASGSTGGGGGAGGGNFDVGSNPDGAGGATPGGGGGGHGRGETASSALSGVGGAGQLKIVISDYTCAAPTFDQIGPYCVNDSAVPLPTTSNEGTSGTWNPTTISTSTAGADTYTFTSNDGCVSTTMMVSVNPPVNAGTNGALTICTGTSVTAAQLFAQLGGTPAVGGTWSPALAGAGTYIYTVTSTAPCTNATAQVVVSDMNCTAMTAATINEPSIYDPCFCGNPLNITGANQEVLLFADFVLISGAAVGDTWILSSVNAGDVLDAAGNPISVGTALNDLGGGDFRLDLFHNPDTGFDATFTGTRADGTPYASSLSVGGSCSPCSLIPTMSQWGLLIFGLLILNLSVGLISEKRAIEKIMS